MTIVSEKFDGIMKTRVLTAAMKTRKQMTKSRSEKIDQSEANTTTRSVRGQYYNVLSLCPRSIIITLSETTGSMVNYFTPELRDDRIYGKLLYS